MQEAVLSASPRQQMRWASAQDSFNPSVFLSASSAIPLRPLRSAVGFSRVWPYCKGSFMPFGIGSGNTLIPSSSSDSVCSGVA
jgi:hypothetical protein